MGAVPSLLLCFWDADLRPAMKSSVLLITLLIPLATFAAETYPKYLKLDKLTLNNGTSFKNVTITYNGSYSIQITHADGVGKFSRTDLPKEIIRQLDSAAEPTIPLSTIKGQVNFKDSAGKIQHFFGEKSFIVTRADYRSALQDYPKGIKAEYELATKRLEQTKEIFALTIEKGNLLDEAIKKSINKRDKDELEIAQSNNARLNHKWAGEMLAADFKLESYKNGYIFASSLQSQSLDSAQMNQEGKFILNVPSNNSYVIVTYPNSDYIHFPIMVRTIDLSRKTQLEITFSNENLLKHCFVAGTMPK